MKLLVFMGYRILRYLNQVYSTPILTFDVWEHAYYLDNQNSRAAHLSAPPLIVFYQEFL